jgi:SRSO17 transposase
MNDLIAEITHLKSRLSNFLKRYRSCVKTAPSREHMKTYMSGQIGPLERKNMEAMALEREIPPRTLQAFMETLRWDEDAVARKNREIIRGEHYDANAIGIIDETSDPKKGDKTTGVKRQYCGATGKRDNCVVSVHLAYVSQEFSALADADLYLPKEWCEDQARREAAGVPEDIDFRTKPEIALDILARTLADGVPMKYLCADELYGRSITFRREAASLGVTYVVEIPCNITGWTESRLKKGRDAIRVDELWKRGGPKWQMLHVKNTGKGPVVWEVRAARFSVKEENEASPAQWLLVARNLLTGEVKYFLSNAPEEMPVETLVHLAFRRWHVERLFEDAKGQAGFDHSQMRKYTPLKRHLILTMTSVLFLMREVARLRKKQLLECGECAVVHRVAA